MKIIGTGLNGLVGSRIQELLENKYSFQNISRTTGVDILNKKQILEFLESSDSPFVLHLAAKTDVDGCENDKSRDELLVKQGETNPHVYSSSAWAINVIGTENIIEACNKTNKKLIYISTDFVFNGEKKEPYEERDKQDAINWYGYTKYMGEKLVQKKSKKWIIARIAYPYRAYFKKNSLVTALLNKLQKQEEFFAVTDHIMTPTFIDDIAFALDMLIENNAEDIYHVVGNEYLSPYDAAIKIAHTFNLSTHTIHKTTRDEFFKNRAPRPFQLAIKNDKIQKLGIKMSTFEEGVKKIKEQID